MHPDFQMNPDIMSKIGDAAFLPALKGPKIGTHRRTRTQQPGALGVVGQDATIAALGAKPQKGEDGMDEYDRKIF